MEKYKLSFCKTKKWANPKAIKIDLDFPCVDTSSILQEGSNRVMPMVAMGRFFSLLRKRTKTFKYADISHFWVSGYIQLEFDLKDITLKKSLKKIVKECVTASGGFLTLEQWYEKHKAEKNKCKIFAFAGTGSQIKGGQINTGYEYQ